MPSYYVKFGLAGYGPDLEPDDEAIPLEDLDYLLNDELNRAADHAEETAYALAERGDFEGAWREHVRSDELATQAANFDPKRREAPLYQGNLPKWLETVTLQLEQTFPLDVGNHERLYVWEAEEAIEPGEGDDYIGETWGGYGVTHDGKYIGVFERYSRAVACLYLARESSSYWPNVWYVNERGNTTLCVFEGHNLRFTDTAYV